MPLKEKKNGKPKNEIRKRIEENKDKMETLIKIAIGQCWMADGIDHNEVHLLVSLLQIVILDLNRTNASV